MQRENKGKEVANLFNYKDGICGSGENNKPKGLYLKRIIIKKKRENEKA